jgi:hypothetical protein
MRWSKQHAAARELRKETGFTPDRPVDLGYDYTFPLADKWRDLYAAGMRDSGRAMSAACAKDSTPRSSISAHVRWKVCART